MVGFKPNILLCISYLFHIICILLFSAFFGIIEYYYYLFYLHHWLFSYNSFLSGYSGVYNICLKLITVYLEIMNHFMNSLRTLQQQTSISFPKENSFELLLSYILILHVINLTIHCNYVYLVNFLLKKTKREISLIFILILFPLLFICVCPNFHQYCTLSARELPLAFCVIQVYWQRIPSIFVCVRTSISSSFKNIFTLSIEFQKNISISLSALDVSLLSSTLYSY